MTTGAERQFEILRDKLKARTNHSGRPLVGYSQSVALIRAELAMLQERIDRGQNDGE